VSTARYSEFIKDLAGNCDHIVEAIAKITSAMKTPFLRLSIRMGFIFDAIRKDVIASTNRAIARVSPFSAVAMNAVPYSDIDSAPLIPDDSNHKPPSTAK
jgi:hypothetical protein